VATHGQISQPYCYQGKNTKACSTLPKTSLGYIDPAGTLGEHIWMLLAELLFCVPCNWLGRKQQCYWM